MLGHSNYATTCLSYRRRSHLGELDEHVVRSHGMEPTHAEGENLSWRQGQEEARRVIAHEETEKATAVVE